MWKSSKREIEHRHAPIEKLHFDLVVDDWRRLTDQLIGQMLAHPILINRPIVVTPWGVRLCRPSEAVLDILLLPQKGPFAKEDGEAVIDDEGKRV